MNIFQAIILSIVEGISEFLPISSTGHLIIAGKLLGIITTEFTKSFDIIIQLGSILAIVVLYFRYVLKNPKVIKPILIGFIPTGIVGLVLYKFIKNYLLDNPTIVVISLLLGGIALIVIEKLHKENKSEVKIEEMSVKNALLIGIGQSISIIPGVSRAAATIVSGMLVGLNRKTAVEFSFLLAVPTMAAATGLDLIKNLNTFTRADMLTLIVGFIGAWITAIIVVKAFIQFVKTNSLVSFGIYRIIAAIVFWILVR